MTPEEFEDALDEFGIDHHRSGKSIVVKECPACGSSNFKVIFSLMTGGDNGALLGKCLRGKCNEGFSSFKYFKQVGIENAKNHALHGRDLRTAIQEHVKDEGFENFGTVAKSKPIEIVPDTDISKFMRIKQWPDHPASKYAVRRGVDPESHDFVRIDVENNAVVFVVKDGKGKVAGYQRRFVNPYDPRMKTQTSYGFTKSENLLEMPNTGKILICEGPFTAIAGWRYGYHSVCTFGAFVSDIQLNKVFDLSIKLSRDIAVAVEGDEAGSNSLERVLTFMFWKKAKVFSVNSDKGIKDLNDAWIAGKQVYESEIENRGPAIPSLTMF